MDDKDPPNREESQREHGFRNILHTNRALLLREPHKTILYGVKPARLPDRRPVAQCLTLDTYRPVIAFDSPIHFDAPDYSGGSISAPQPSGADLTL